MAPCRSGRRGILGSTEVPLVEVRAKAEPRLLRSRTSIPDAESRPVRTVFWSWEKLSRTWKAKTQALAAGTRRLSPPGLSSFPVTGIW